MESWKQHRVIDEYILMNNFNIATICQQKIMGALDWTLEMFEKKLIIVKTKILWKRKKKFKRFLFWKAIELRRSV